MKAELQRHPIQRTVTTVRDTQGIRANLDKDIVLHESHGEVIHINDPTFPYKEGKVPVRWDKLLRKKPAFRPNDAGLNMGSNEKRVISKSANRSKPSKTLEGLGALARCLEELELRPK